jgi:chromosome partitioning protein
MKTLAIIGQKGGTGKTTLAQIIAVAAEQAGTAAAIIDLDPQASTVMWQKLRDQDAPAVIDTKAVLLPEKLTAAKEAGFGLAVVDTAGRAQHDALAAAKAADLVLLPMQPTFADLRTLESAQEIIKLTGNPRHVAILTRVKAKGTRHTETAEWLKGQGVEVCPVAIGDRVTYQDAYAQGMTPTEFDPKSKAAEECRAFYTFFSKLLKE